MWICWQPRDLAASWRNTMVILNGTVMLKRWKQGKIPWSSPPISGQEIKSERCCWRSESERSSTYLYHSFYLSSFIGQAKMLQMKAFGATVMIDHQQYSWTCFNLGGFLLFLCQSRYLTPCPLVIWSYLNTTLLNFSFHC